MEKPAANPKIYRDVITLNIDVQNDFALPEGSLSVRDGEAIIEPLNAINEWTRQHNGRVIFTRDWHPPTTAHFAEFGGTWPIHCVADTAGAKLHDDLAVNDGDIIANKGTSMEDDGYSGWQAVDPVSGDSVASLIRNRLFEARNDHERTLAEEKPLAILIGGLATDYCVLATCLDAVQTRKAAYKDADFTIDLYLLNDAVRAVNVQPGDDTRALQQIADANIYAISTKDILAGGIAIDASRIER